ncbi:hypothetical protein EIP86_000354 [Pleurotus ostreatoroseus]|nr:hypothetical protein EIP86_000354 [Pleurotus ostreatoroseus]
MNSPPPRRGHRKRISALRLSTDSTVPALPLYTSPPWQRPVEYIEDPSDLPPDYPSSAEEADADTETDDETTLVYSPSPPPITFSPRRTRQSRGSSRNRRQNNSNDPLDSLLARSVHALEMSNALLQSSMSTQTSLNNVLAGDSAEADMQLESQARTLSARIAKEDNWKDDLDKISKGVDSLFAAENLSSDGGRTTTGDDSLPEDLISQSLPASSSLSTVADRAARRHLRRPSLDLRNASLHFSNHARNDLVAPAPRALTMYVDTTEDTETISMPSTLGLRSNCHVLPAPPEPSQAQHRPLLLHATGSEGTLLSKSAADMLASYVMPRRGSSSTRSDSRTASPCSTVQRRPRSGSASTSTTTVTRKARSSSSVNSRSSSHSPSRHALRTWDTPPIIELPSASSSSSSEDLHVDRTLTSLRTILQNNPPPPPKVPAFLKPTAVEPVADTSHATASVSRLFTKPRHTSSTRPPSPPRVSAMKGRSGRSAPPTPISPALSSSSSWLSVSDAFGVGGSGRSTPSRVSFIEPPDADTHGKDKSTLKTRSRSKSRRRKGKGREASSSDEGAGKWWMWLLGPAPPAHGKRGAADERHGVGPASGLWG